MKNSPRAAVKQVRPRGKSGTQSKVRRIDKDLDDILVAASLEVGKPVDQMIREGMTDYIGGYLAGLLAYHRSKRGTPAHPAK